METEAQHQSKPSKNPDSYFTFQVDKVDPRERIPNLSPATSIIQGLVGRNAKSEDNSHRTKQDQNKYFSGRLHGLIEAIHLAYDEHYRVQLSVSDFIILIGQGLSRHINSNPEKLRDVFVNHQDKEIITIRRDEFALGKQNDWSSSFGEFAEEIKKRVKTDIYDIVVDDTSVATKTTRIVSEITLMNCMKAYFGYKKRTGCGIPEITLKGAPEDWENLREKVRKLVEMNKGDRLDLAWWLDRLVPVVEKICDAGFLNEVDKEFWSGIYKYERLYMRNLISGWITVFFPYILESRMEYGRNPFDGKMTSGNIPQDISKVPLVWEIGGKEIKMNICSGFLGAKFSKKNFKVKPEVFWSVVYAEEDEK